MQDKVRTIKSPLVPGQNKLPVTKVENIIFNIILPNGMIITNPDQFQDEYNEEYENAGSESTASYTL
jgi:hypothetical protein